MQWTELQAARCYEIMEALAAVGLALRPDASVCWNYIVNGHGSAATAAIKAAEAHFLHNYCDFQKALIRLRAERMPLTEQEYRRKLTSYALETVNLQYFPSVWPWLTR